MKERIIQFGTGNFLRGFTDCFIDILNEKGLYDGKILIVKPTEGEIQKAFKVQDFKYNLYLRGSLNGEEICERREINSISRVISPYENFDEFLRLAHNPDFRFVFSNTTEAGIEFEISCNFEDKPASSFPGKVTQFLFERFKSGLSGLVFLPCELIDNNGDRLKECVLKYAVLWSLGENFINYVKTENTFCNTLVDRIVTGYPKDEAEKFFGEIAYEDKLLCTAEPYHLWVIEGDFERELPLKKAGFNIIWTDNVSPYKKMKVRILNGIHTSMVFPALLAGIETVGACFENELISAFVSKILREYILPTLGETQEVNSFAQAVIERFKNPFICHKLQSIALNSVSKFSVRVLPTMIEYKKNYGEVPKTLALSLAALIFYYKNYPSFDNTEVVEFIKSNTINTIISATELWKTDIFELNEAVTAAYEKIQFEGIYEAIKWSLS